MPLMFYCDQMNEPVFIRIHILLRIKEVCFELIQGKLSFSTILILLYWSETLVLWSAVCGLCVSFSLVEWVL